MNRTTKVLLSDRLGILYRKSRMSVHEISESTGIPQSILNNYRQGRTDPTLNDFLVLCDFFGISADYLLGRSDSSRYIDESVSDASDDFRKRYDELHRNIIERVCKGFKVTDLKMAGKHSCNTNGIEMYAVWPYNLIDDIEKNMDESEKSIIPLSDDQKAGFDKMLSMLNDNERDVAIRYYKNGQTNVEISDDYKVTRQRVNQILQKAIGKMKHPSYHNLLKYGLKGFNEHRENINLHIKMREAERKKMEAEKAERRLQKLADSMNIKLEYVGHDTVSTVEYVQEFSPVKLASLGLRRRTFRCLHSGHMYIRGQYKEVNMDTVGEFATFLHRYGRKGLNCIKGMGPTSISDIDDRLHETIGIGIDNIA